MAGAVASHVPTEELEKILNTMGPHMDPELRAKLMKTYLQRKSTVTAAPSQYSPMMGAISHAVNIAGYDITHDHGGAANAQTFKEFAEQYLAGMDAAKLVLEFLQAQGGMGLFDTNPMAKRLYERIITAGVREVLYNNARYGE